MSTFRSRFIRYHLPAIAWALLIFVGSSIPSRAFPTLKIFDFDKLIHTTIFYVLGILVYRSLMRSGDERSFSVRRALLAVLVVMIYGILDEFHQTFTPGRTPDVWDATADTIGGILSAITLFVFHARGKFGPAGDH